VKISEYLRSLGDTPQAVAASLRAQRVKGKRKDPKFCPVVNGIYQAIPDYWPGLEVVGGVKGGVARYSACLHDIQIFDPVLPQAVQDFIGDFDLGEYPDLVAERVEETLCRKWR